MRPGFWQIAIVIILALILFGHAKFPAMMKNLAEGIKVFKKEIKDDKPEDKPKPEMKKKPAKEKAKPKSRAVKKTTKK